MNFIKDWANVCKTCTCYDRLKVPVKKSFDVARTQLHLDSKSFLWFQHNSTKESNDTSRTL